MLVILCTINMTIGYGRILENIWKALSTLVYIPVSKMTDGF